MLSNETNAAVKFERLIKKLEEEEKTREERIVTLRNISVNDRGELMFEDWTESLPMSGIAIQQLAKEFDLPGNYFVSLIRKSPKLLAEQFNWFISNEPKDFKRKVRIKNGYIQAILSTRYQPFDHLDLLNSFEDVRHKFPPLAIEKIHHDDRQLNIRLTFPDMKREFGNDVRDFKDEIMTGIDLFNSEVGYRSVGVTPIIYRLVCSNGMRANVFGETMRQRHSGFDRDTFRQELTKGITKSITIGNSTLETMTRAKQIPMNYAEEIPAIATRWNIPKRDMEVITRNFEEHDPEPSLYGIVNAVTRTARDLKNVDAQHKLEHIASEILYAHVN